MASQEANSYDSEWKFVFVNCLKSSNEGFSICQIVVTDIEAKCALTMNLFKNIHLPDMHRALKLFPRNANVKRPIFKYPSSLVHRQIRLACVFHPISTATVIYYIQLRCPVRIGNSSRESRIWTFELWFLLRRFFPYRRARNWTNNKCIVFGERRALANGFTWNSFTSVFDAAVAEINVQRNESVRRSSFYG